MCVRVCACTCALPDFSVCVSSELLKIMKFDLECKTVLIAGNVETVQE